MSGIYIFSENIAVATELITAGLELKNSMSQPVVVLTTNSDDSSGYFAAGADKVVVLGGTNSWPESYATAISDAISCQQASVLLVGATARGKDIAAKVAAKIQAGLVTEAQSVAFVDDEIQTTRMMYGGLALCTESISLPALVTIPPRTFEPPTPGDNQGELMTIEAATDERITISDVCPIEREGVDITEADRLVCIGRGLAKQEDISIAQMLADKLGAELACSRSIAEDYHWLPIERYIGISGQKVKPELYFSLGVSGQVQHVAGIRDSKIIVAIDSNEKAPIFEAADYGIVGDLYEVVPMLVEALK